MAIVLISRGTHSGGKEVAETVASKLGYPCLSREAIIKEASIDFQIPEEDMIATMGDPPGFWHRIPSKRFAHINFIRSTLAKHFKQGNLVFHGYAAHLLLSKSLKKLRVRINADKEFRIAAAMRDENIDRGEAIKLIQKTDAQSTKWAKALYGIEWCDPSIYDTVFNLQRMSKKAIIDTIARMTTMDDFTIDEAGMTEIDNLTMSSSLLSDLSRDPRTAGTRLLISANEGEVTLKGYVSSNKVLNAVLEVTKARPGVKLIKNSVVIENVDFNLMWSSTYMG